METRIILKSNTKSFVYCPECRKILYEMPVKEIVGIYRRVASSTAIGHNDFLGHNAEIIIKPLDAIDENQQKEPDHWMDHVQARKN